MTVELLNPILQFVIALALLAAYAALKAAGADEPVLLGLLGGQLGGHGITHLAAQVAQAREPGPPPASTPSELQPREVPQ